MASVRQNDAAFSWRCTAVPEESVRPCGDLGAVPEQLIYAASAMTSSRRNVPAPT